MFSVLIFLFFCLFLQIPLSLFENDISSITYAYCLIIGYGQNKNNLLQNKYTKKRLISNVARATPDTAKRNLVCDADFYEWLRGFTVLRGCPYLRRRVGLFFNI